MTGNAVDGTLMLLGLIAVVTIVLLAFGKLFLIGLDAIITKWRRLGIVPRIVALLMAAVATVEAQKSGMGDSNRVERVDRVEGGGGDFSRKEHKESVGVDGEELKLGVEVEQMTDKPSAVQLGLETSTHLLVSVKTNDSYSYAMPENAVRYPNWWMRGGYEDVFKLDLDDWRFPLGTNLVNYLWVYTWGKVRPRLKAKESEIAAVGFPMSAVPQVSEFWYADGTNGSKILTWHNFFLGRVPLSVSSVYSVVPISAQLELFPSGDYIARSDLVERYFKRINPDDFDDDGIPDGVDENPELSDGDFFGPDNDLPEGANSNNYCWVDVVVSNANSLVTFIGDRPSNLPEPRFIAKPDVTNRVTLLIGKTYRVTSAQPIICTAKSSGDIIVDQDDERLMTIVYPVSYEIVDKARYVSRQIRMIPPSLVGTFNWNTNTCCTQVQTSPSELPKCAWDCACQGCTLGGFSFDYEGYSLNFGGIGCGCSVGECEGSDDNQDGASVSVSFSEGAIIFENQYETSPSVFVGLQSTTTTVACAANGGPNGGMVYFTITGEDKLCKINGEELPYTRQLLPNENVNFEIKYTGKEASVDENDVEIKATFTENGTNRIITDEAELTVICVEFVPEVSAPANECYNRHVCGVGEILQCFQSPATPKVEWLLSNNSRMRMINKFVCPLLPMEKPIVAKCKGASYIPLISVIAPSGIKAQNVGYEVMNVSSNEAGGLVLAMDLYVMPLEVSFSRISIEEVPCDVGMRSGYFSRQEFSSMWCHSRENGAGNWINVEKDNFIGRDRAGITNELFRIHSSGILIDDEDYEWTDGRLEWDVPYGWNEKDTGGEIVECGRFAEDVKQVMVIFSDGRFGVRKHSNVVIRYADGRVYLNGVQKQ